MTISTTFGSQRLLQIAVNNRPQLLLSAIRRSGAVGRCESLSWVSPLSHEKHSEYRGSAAIDKLGLAASLQRPLLSFWPLRGCVWDGLALAGDRPVLVEAKAHIPEVLSPPSKACPKSARLIDASLAQAKRHYGSRSKANWGRDFYQYTNRLAYQYFLRQLNGVQSSMVFLYFTNATDMDGPNTEEEWKGATRLMHSMLGLPVELARFGVYHAFLDSRALMDVA